MSDAEAIEALNERIKELTCLYDISTLANEHSDSFPDALQAIAIRLARAWKHASAAKAEINIRNQSFISADLPVKSVSMMEPVMLEKEQIGFVRIHYPAEAYTQKDFLTEEQHLLKKAAQEIAGIFERHQRNEREEVLKRSVERSDRLGILGEITAGIAHELNTPLGNILGFSELISEKTGEAQIKSDAEKIADSAIYAREVVKKLMFFSCEMPQQMESISINPLIEDAIKLLKPSLNNAKIELRFYKDPKNPFGRLDPIQITQVIFNLLINAIYASPPNSIIKVVVSSWQKKLNITIEDEGVGIPADLSDKIFEPFFTTKPIGEGSGLGLSVVHGIIKSHQGQIRYSSEVGKGTTFNITLPLHP